MSLGHPQQLKWLVEKGLIMKYPRGNGFRFKRSDCRKVAEQIDLSKIDLPMFGNNTDTKKFLKNKNAHF
jgi:hypothetical protein